MDTRRLSRAVALAVLLAAPAVLAQPRGGGPPAVTPTGGSPVRIWLLDPSGNVEGMLLQNDQRYHLTPDAARMLTASVHLGDPLRVLPNGSIIDERDGSRIDTQGVDGHYPAVARAPMTASGPVAIVLRNPRGQVDALVLSTGEQVWLTPAAARAFEAQHVHLGDPVLVQGVGHRSRWGIGMLASGISLGIAPRAPLPPVQPPAPTVPPGR